MRRSAAWILGLAGTVLMGSSLLAQGYLSPVETNKKVVFDFYRLVVEPRNPDLIPIYVSDDFVDHDRSDEKGAQAVEKMLKALGAATSDEVGAALRRPPKLVMAQGDLVMWAFDDPGDSKRLLIEAYRIKDRKIVEHWKGIGTAP
jgi:predicted SnoaL-like aldol condensation-catalyzing enzyme